jgi:hypothetical protein
MPSVPGLHKERERGQERTCRRPEEGQATRMRVRKGGRRERDLGKISLKLGAIRHRVTVPGYSEQEEPRKELVQEMIYLKLEAIHRKREGEEVVYSVLEARRREQVVVLTFQELEPEQRLLVEVRGKMVVAPELVYHPREVGKMDCRVFGQGDMVSMLVSLAREDDLVQVLVCQGQGQVDLVQGLCLLEVEAQEQTDVGQAIDQVGSVEERVCLVMEEVQGEMRREVIDQVDKV